jgi:hypothetical protein
VRKIFSDRDLAAVVDKRLPASAIKSLIRAGLIIKDSEVHLLIVPWRTLAHHIARREPPMTREQSIREFERISAKARRKLRFKTWQEADRWAKGQWSPQDLRGRTSSWSF